ncbi:heme peroxidase [Tuber magnatum]|uniref:Peroxidase n=1 Tax=Tuber magnatum TaxID=42249 RepID=A0A317SP86_9PEZI|nr:heme peroxidase [Tuber magnatum]
MASVARTFSSASSKASFTFTPLRRNLTTASRARPTTSIATPIRQTGRRGYASGGSTSGGSSKIVIPLGLGLVGAAGYYAYSNNLLSSVFAGARASGLKTGGAFTPTRDDFQRVYNDVAEILENNDYDNGSYGPVVVRLGWHASGTYDKETKTGGSNGATMRFAPESEHGANAGLKTARDLLEGIKKKHPWISYSDLWTLAAVAAIQEMGGPKIPWRPGRKDGDVSACTPDGRLPDASKDQKHLRAIFYRMGFNDQEIVALSGAHALGRCHTDRSGFDGPWTFSPTMLTNDYYKLLLEEKWAWKKWNGPKQFEDVSTKSLMMLPTDMALIKDKEFKKHVERYAKDNDLFFRDFADVFGRLLELGVPFEKEEKFIFKSTTD